MALLTPIPNRLRPFVKAHTAHHAYDNGTTTLSAELCCPLCAGVRFTLFGVKDRIVIGPNAGGFMLVDPVSVQGGLKGTGFDLPGSGMSLDFPHAAPPTQRTGGSGLPRPQPRPRPRDPVS
jgi:hypothetical protein